MKSLYKGFMIGLVMLLLTACGSGDGDKEYIIASDNGYPPFEWAEASGTYVGIDVDIMNAIAEDQGIKIKMDFIGFTGAVASLKSGQADAVLAGMTITDERLKVYDFSDPYYDVSVTMAVAIGSDITSYEDLRGKRVAIKTSTNGADFAESIKEQYGFEVVYFDDSATMYTEVVSGNAVACFEDAPVMEYSIAKNGVQLVTTGVSEIPSQYGFAVMKGENAELLEKFNAGLANIKANGKYQEIVDKYTK
ncbi:glutamine ABC transporter substrate-binding protein [Erysipelothrix larvae]|uniref:Glutamine ABC transporter substrate-binding protein n=1 Tax=Erysipelothrix larvae TaxID=1514105 RepID=A0A0X8H1R9_9FIRM|nr:transporter substrate-binding domain-containing protein [Erysipelothrix larvae]AMC94259.1 glutamine ABC transporter substrate-binding protein [Erysipelothrix larvae]